MLRKIAVACKVIPSVIRPIQSNTLLNIPNSFKILNCGLKTSCVKNDLMEFFDVKTNWGQAHIKIGRAWSLDELRLKSNVDLHKLWYVLLKEQNMLLTMEHESKERLKLFPNPERIDKVKISMKNLEQVVRERNKAYHLLETGDNGERKVNRIRNEFGLFQYVKEKEYIVPRYMQRSRYTRPTNASMNFIRLYREKKNTENRRSTNRNRNHVLGLLKRFPNIDKEELQRKYPDVNVDKLSNSRKADGHFVKEL